MENMLGGFVQFDYLPSYLVNGEVIHNGYVQLSLVAGQSWRSLPSFYMKSEVSDNPTSDDSGYLNSLSVVLDLRNLSAPEFQNLSFVVRQGIILRGRKSDGTYMIYGSPQYPLRGTLRQLPGVQPSDSIHYQMELSSSLCHPPLPLKA